MHHALSPTGLCAPGDLWPAQPVCVTGGFGCALESGGPATLPPPAAVPSRYVLPWPGGPACGAGSRSSRQPGCALESGRPATLPSRAAVPSRYVLPWPGGPARGAGSRSSWQPGCPAGTFSRPGRGWEPVLTAVITPHVASHRPCSQECLRLMHLPRCAQVRVHFRPA